MTRRWSFLLPLIKSAPLSLTWSSCALQTTCFCFSAHPDTVSQVLLAMLGWWCAEKQYDEGEKKGRNKWWEKQRGQQAWLILFFLAHPSQTAGQNLLEKIEQCSNKGERHQRKTALRYAKFSGILCTNCKESDTDSSSWTGLGWRVKKVWSQKKKDRKKVWAELLVTRLEEVFCALGFCFWFKKISAVAFVTKTLFARD